MRTILVDYARARSAAKRDSGAPVLPFNRDGPAIVGEDRAEHLIALDEALTRLALVNREACQTVEYRYFAGLTLEEAATVLDLSVATVRRRWEFAKAWLQAELQETS